MSEPRTVLVTGGNRGIGLAIARSFAATGDKVAVTHHSGEAPEGLVGVRCDVTDSASVDAAFTEAEGLLGGPVEVLVANAGVTKDGLLMRMSDEDFDSVIDTNLTGAFRCARRASKGRSAYAGAASSSSPASSGSTEAGTRPTTRRARRAGRPGPLDRENRRTRHHRQRRGSRLHQDRHDRGAPRGHPQDVLSGDPRRPIRHPEGGRAASLSASTEAAYISGAVIPVDGGLGMGH